MPRILLVIVLLVAFAAGCGSSPPPMRTSDPNLSQAHLERAKFFWAHGEVNKTIQEMEWALAANPYNYNAAYNLGLIYLDQGQRISARRVWENALLSMEDGGEQMEDYDNARVAADIRAALAELEKADRQLGRPEAILARQQAEQTGIGESLIGNDSSYSTSSVVTTTSSYASQTGQTQTTVGTAGATSGTGTAGTSTATSTTGATSATGNKPLQFQPKPYVPHPQDGKPRATGSRQTSGQASSQGSSGQTRVADCPPCAPQRSGQYAIQVSSNRQESNAKADARRLSNKGYHASISANQLASGTWYVVWVGCCTSKEQAEKLAAQLKRERLIPNDARVVIPR